MNFLKWIANGLVILINILLVYFVATGLYGHFIAYSPERKEKWLLATMVWVVVLVIVDSIYLLLRLFFRRKIKVPEKQPVQYSFFYKREEFPDKIVYRFKNSGWIYPLIGIGLIAYFLSIHLRILHDYIFYWVYGVPAIIYFFMSFFSHLGPNKEIRVAMKRGGVKVSGSKYSFKNPLIVTIEKEKELSKNF